MKDPGVPDLRMARLRASRGSSSPVELSRRVDVVLWPSPLRVKGHHVTASRADCCKHSTHCTDRNSVELCVKILRGRCRCEARLKGQVEAGRGRHSGHSLRGKTSHARLTGMLRIA